MVVLHRGGTATNRGKSFSFSMCRNTYGFRKFSWFKNRFLKILACIQKFREGSQGILGENLNIMRFFSSWSFFCYLLIYWIEHCLKWITRVFIEQTLTLPGSANNWGNMFIDLINKTYILFRIAVACWSVEKDHSWLLRRI